MVLSLCGVSVSSVNVARKVIANVSVYWLYGSSDQVCISIFLACGTLIFYPDDSVWDTGRHPISQNRYYGALRMPSS